MSADLVGLVGCLLWLFRCWGLIVGFGVCWVRDDRRCWFVVSLLVPLWLVFKVDFPFSFSFRWFCWYGLVFT